MTWIDDENTMEIGNAPTPLPTLPGTRALLEREDDKKIEEQRCLRLIIMAHSKIHEDLTTSAGSVYAHE